METRLSEPENERSEPAEPDSAARGSNEGTGPDETQSSLSSKGKASGDPSRPESSDGGLAREPGLRPLPPVYDARKDPALTASSEAEPSATPDLEVGAPPRDEPDLGEDADLDLADSGSLMDLDASEESPEAFELDLQDESGSRLDLDLQGSDPEPLETDPGESFELDTDADPMGVALDLEPDVPDVDMNDEVDASGACTASDTTTVGLDTDGADGLLSADPNNEAAVAGDAGPNEIEPSNEVNASGIDSAKESEGIEDEDFASQIGSTSEVVAFGLDAKVEAEPFDTDSTKDDAASESAAGEASAGSDPSFGETPDPLAESGVELESAEDGNPLFGENEIESVEAVSPAEAEELESRNAVALAEADSGDGAEDANPPGLGGSPLSVGGDGSEPAVGTSGSGESEEAVISVLLVEEDQLSADRLFEVLADATPTRFEVTHVLSVDQALEKLHDGSYDVLLIDLSIQEGYGLESLYRARVAAETVPIVVLTYQNDMNLALKATRAGAQDYLIKGEVTPALITRSLAHAVERHGMLKDLRDAQQRQWFLANHDPLTSLQNRAALLNSARATIESAKRRNGRLAFLFIDLDGFKPVNDNLGHAIGDEMLADVAGRLRRIRPRRDLVARLGGDEFVVVAVDPPDDEAHMRIAEEIRDEIEKPYHVGGVECFISASIGVATFPEDGTDADELIRRADTAMYASKAAGRNAVTTFESDMDEKTQERFALVNSLREAIRAGDLLIEFQPQIEVATERVVGAETLVRWRHPTRGVVAPSEFIGVAEDTGMMNPLGEWVLRTACTAASRWTELDDIRLAVNISGRQLEQRDFTQRMKSILEETGVDPGRLELELTESLAAKDSTLKALSGLRDLGVRIAIDDFGTGYSSFTLLKKLPADLLKIDQSFVRDAMTQESGVVILDAILRMARGLGMEVIAEGVETVEEMDLLLSLGCNLMQGYLLGKPVPKNDFEPMMTADDALWRLPIERPETWNPPSVEELRNVSTTGPDDPDSLGEESFPALKF